MPAATVTSDIAKPRQKIATLHVCFLEYNARSLNGRIYPKATCDRIYASATRKLADANSLPMTCFVSHEAANGNVNTDLVGHVSRIWQEGSKFYADLDLADTSTARDMLALVTNGALRSESMRVLGVDLVHDRNYDLPLVVVPEGIEPELLGIDLTTRPGLTTTARIQQVSYESANAAAYIESFPLTELRIEKGNTTMTPTELYIAELRKRGYHVEAQKSQPQRVTESLAFEPGYGDDYDASPFSGKLHPKNWRALANRRVPWPADVNPEEALQHLAGILEYQIQSDAEAARGRSLPEMIRSGKVQ